MDAHLKGQSDKLVFIATLQINLETSQSRSLWLGKEALDIQNYPQQNI